MQDFEYRAPKTLNEAIQLMAEKGAKARALAGGTDLLVQLRVKRYIVDRVVDVKHVPEFNELSYSDAKGLVLGAAVPCCRVYENNQISAKYPALYDSAFLIGGIQIQSRGSIGGNLANAAPSADAIPALIALGATANIAGPKGKRSVPAEQFCAGPGKTVLQDGELLVSISIPPPQQHTGSTYIRFIPRNEMDIAVAGVGVSVVLNGSSIKSARIALASVGPTPIYAAEASGWLAGKAPTDDNILQASEAAKKAAKPITDMRGTIEQRIHLVGVLTKRSLQSAITRAKEAK
ncbi:MAG: xanthine dehydrogenase family protein subunit M [Chloroflexi bacterium]|nr:xanthine dehydrogenase family protein subunit M [Chloroflexota bacterium]